jgi:phosphoserine phosphatase
MSVPFEDLALTSLAKLSINKLNVRLLSRYRETLIPFIGAGLSADFGYPPWHRLIEDLAESAGFGSDVATLIAEDKFEEAAELVYSAMPNQFDDALRETFRHDGLERPLPKGAVRHLPGIGRGIVLTTNFDCVLEAAFEDAHRSFSQVFSGARIREASRAVQLNEPCLLKLHGDYRDSEGRILTVTEYAREYGSADPNEINFELPLPTVLSQALASRPILFLGCSLKTDRTIGIIRNLAKRYPGVMHFALLSSAEATPPRLRQLDDWNIRPLFFPAGEFDRIEEFLSCFARHCRGEIPASATSKRKKGWPGRSAVSRRGSSAAPVLASSQRVGINGFKLFYFRRMRKLGIRALSKLAGVKEMEIRRIERINMRTGPLGSHCFQPCQPNVLMKVEDALDCRGTLAAGKPDDFLTQYMLFYKMYRGTHNSGDQDEDQMELSFETKAVVFDFDGTLTARSDDETTWEKIWVSLGYSINDCAELHHKFSQGKFSHQEWCNITRDRFRKADFSKRDLREISRSILLIDGFKETLETLRDRSVKLYILSGSIKQVITEVLGECRGWFEEVQANEILFDSAGAIREIRGTLYDFEGKAQFLSRIIDDNRYSPYDVLFVGNSCNDIFASRSGARTLCVNPRATNPDNKEHWTYLIKRMDNLNQILRYAHL